MCNYSLFQLKGGRAYYMHNINEKNFCITPEDILEFVYEISDKWKDENDPIESMKSELRTMIRFFKEKKFKILQEELGIIY
jgi:hypothetical protein